MFADDSVMQGFGLSGAIMFTYLSRNISTQYQKGS